MNARLIIINVRDFDYKVTDSIINILFSNMLFLCINYLHKRYRHSSDEFKLDAFQTFYSLI